MSETHSHVGANSAAAEPCAADLERFAELQRDFTRSYEAIFADRTLPRTVVILPSLSLDADVMAKITGVTHYEERMLCLLLLLRLPRTRAKAGVTSHGLASSVFNKMGAR